MNNTILQNLKEIKQIIQQIENDIPSIRTIYENDKIKIVCIPTGYKLDENNAYIKELYTACEPTYPEFILKQSLYTYSDENEIYILLYCEDVLFKTV